MIKCNVKVCGIINRTASVKQTSDGKSFVVFGLSVDVPSTKGDAVPVNISVAAENADVSALTQGRRVSIEGVLKIKGAPEKKTYFIKRIIGLPGETIQIDEEGNIYVDDALLEENYGKETILDPGRAIEPIKLGKDEYFVLGDNRNNSSDGRDPVVGNIKRENITGRAWLRIYPFHKFGFVKHR